MKAESIIKQTDVNCTQNSGGYLPPLVYRPVRINVLYVPW
jgi:hypothetical protein